MHLSLHFNDYISLISYFEVGPFSSYGAAEIISNLIPSGLLD